MRTKGAMGVPKRTIKRFIDVPEEVAALRDELTMAQTMEEMGRLGDLLREALRRWKNEMSGG